MSTNEPQQASFLTTQQAARLLGVSVRTIQLWVESGVLHAWKTAGGHRRVARASVDALREQQREVIETVTGLQSGKILVIEDNPNYLELYRLKIESWLPGAILVTASNGLEALVAVGKLDPHVIIVELQMPGMDSFEMIRSLQGGAPNAELIVLSSLSDEEIEEIGGLPEGAAVLPNPVDLDRLEALLREKISAPRA